MERPKKSWATLIWEALEGEGVKKSKSDIVDQIRAKYPYYDNAYISQTKGWVLTMNTTLDNYECFIHDRGASPILHSITPDPRFQNCFLDGVYRPPPKQYDEEGLVVASTAPYSIKAKRRELTNPVSKANKVASRRKWKEANPEHARALAANDAGRKLRGNAALAESVLADNLGMPLDEETERVAKRRQRKLGMEKIRNDEVASKRRTKAAHDLFEEALVNAIDEDSESTR